MEYTKTIDGQTVIRDAGNIVIRKDGKMIINPSEEEILEDGWVLFVKSEPSQEEIFNNQKNLLIDQVLYYDSSSYVNEFYIQDIPV